jgi:hypothetical protein
MQKVEAEITNHTGSGMAEANNNWEHCDWSPRQKVEGKLSAVSDPVRLSNTPEFSMYATWMTTPPCLRLFSLER